MSKLGVDQRTIRSLFEDKKSLFVIPDYQRPYAWGDKECRTLWDDIFEFAFPEGDCDKFSSDNDEYFLGPIVTFKNEEGKQEVIDGQQRLTTLMLLLRAFYDRYGYMKNERAIKTREMIGKCIWKTNEYDELDKSQLKIDSEVATDTDKEEFLYILQNGEAPDAMKSAYVRNYRHFQDWIALFQKEYPDFFSLLPIRIMNNCILLPIEADTQETALRIFATLNDRGKPLSDSDIFKAQLYKYYTGKDKKDEFIAKWKDLDDLCEEIYKPITGTPMDEAFTRYMYYARARLGMKSSTTEALRKFYERNSYELLRNDQTFEDIIELTHFWDDVYKQDEDRFSDAILRRLFVLNYAPNGMWTYIVSVYYLANRDENGLLEEEAFYEFLCKITGFIWAYAVTNPGVNALRTPIYAEMIKIVNHEPVTFADFRLNGEQVSNAFNNYSFSNNRAITRSMVTWWTFEDEKQELLSLATLFDIEHIFAKKRQEIEGSLKNRKSLEALGNKALLEKSINIRAADYKFADKKKYYQGYTNNKKQWKDGTKIVELKTLADKYDDFRESDIVQRTSLMLHEFWSYLERHGLIAEE